MGDRLTAQKMHTFGAFKSASGLGIAVLIKINPKKHLESFLSLERYYLEKFQIILDKSCKDVTRPRFVSYDPNAYINHKAATYSNFLKKNDCRDFSQWKKRIFIMALSIEQKNTQ